MVLNAPLRIRRAMLLLLMVAGLIALAAMFAPPANADGAESGDEITFYRGSDGTFRYYDVKTTGQLGTLINGGDGYTNGWTTIASIDLDGGGQDEVLFYRSSDGTFRYYDIKANGQLGIAGAHQWR